MLINETYFQGDIMIPNITEVHSDNDFVRGLIESESRLLLESVLGFELFNEFVSNLDGNGNLKPDAGQKWKNLVYGNIYEVGNINHQFKGLIQETPLYKTSLIADYVYYRWMKSTSSQSTGTGEAVLNGKNSSNVNGSQKLVTIWNRFFKLLTNGSHQKPYRGYVNGVCFVDWYGSNQRNSVSVFQFLTDNKEDYPNPGLQLPLSEDYFGYKNQLGL